MALTNPLHVFISAFVIGGLGGTAAFLRSRRDITWRNLIGSVLSSALIGLITALLSYNHFKGADSIYFLLGMSGLVGSGGVTVIDLMLKIAKKGGVQIVISPQEDSDDRGHNHD